MKFKSLLSWNSQKKKSRVKAHNRINNNNLRSSKSAKCKASS